MHTNCPNLQKILNLKFKTHDRNMTYKKFDPAIAERKQKNAAIFRLTTKLIQLGGYTTPSGKHIQFDFTQMLQFGKCFQEELPVLN